MSKKLTYTFRHEDEDLFRQSIEMGHPATSGKSVETLIIAPHPDLTPDQQAVIADDYGMENRELHLTVRRALKLYYLRMLHLDEVQGTLQTEQIVWLIRDQLEPKPSQYQYD